ncbi:MAG: helix-turn-helix domain containing protein [Mediterranea sp.]|jgi:hypothetical protein|nr:helix-turn-helix domain containing protein [Mediterranea sp.]
MSRKINKVAVLDRIKAYYSLKSNAKLAAFLGVAPTTVSSWYSRDTFDLDILYAKCVDLSFDWLLAGDEVAQEEAPIELKEPSMNNHDDTLYYKMYKEEREQNTHLTKEYGRLEERLEQSDREKAELKEDLAKCQLELSAHREKALGFDPSTAATDAPSSKTSKTSPCSTGGGSVMPQTTHLPTHNNK